MCFKQWCSVRFNYSGRSLEFLKQFMHLLSQTWYSVAIQHFWGSLEYSDLGYQLIYVDY